jgi:hypothetical protein
MSTPSNGITAEAIRGVMPPYRLSRDLLAATFAALPAARPTLPSPGAATDHAPAAPEWTITTLDEGPGWSREVLRHRGSPTPGNAAASSEVP